MRVVKIIKISQERDWDQTEDVGSYRGHTDKMRRYWGRDCSAWIKKKSLESSLASASKWYQDCYDFLVKKKKG